MLLFFQKFKYSNYILISQRIYSHILKKNLTTVIVIQCYKYKSWSKAEAELIKYPYFYYCSQEGEHQSYFYTFLLRFFMWKVFNLTTNMRCTNLCLICTIIFLQDVKTLDDTEKIGGNYDTSQTQTVRQSVFFKNTKKQFRRVH